MTLLLPDKLQRLVRLAQHARGTRETARLALNCFSLTGVTGEETKDDVLELCDIAKHTGLASVVLPPPHIQTARGALRDAPASLLMFVNSTSPDAIRQEIATGIGEGATGFALPFPAGLMRARKTTEVKEILIAGSKAAGTGRPLTVILETKDCDSAEELRRACQVAIYCRADCLKTSTGTQTADAHAFAAAAILMEEAQRAPHAVGVEISDGLRTNDDCAKFITLARGIRGGDSIVPELFKIGAGTLVDDLVHALGRNKQPLYGAPEYVY